MSRSLKDVPLIFPFSFAVMALIIFFAGAYGVAESAVSDQPAVDSASSVASSAEHDWYESAAIFVCPLH